MLANDLNLPPIAGADANAVADAIAQAEGNANADADADAGGVEGLLEANRQGIEANRQGIEANRQGIEELLRDWEAEELHVLREQIITAPLVIAVVAAALAIFFMSTNN